MCEKEYDSQTTNVYSLLEYCEYFNKSHSHSEEGGVDIGADVPLFASPSLFFVSIII